MLRAGFSCLRFRCQLSTMGVAVKELHGEPYELPNIHSIVTEFKFFSSNPDKLSTELTGQPTCVD